MKKSFTVIEISPQFMIGAAFDHFRDMLRLLVDGHGSDDAAMWRRGGQLDLDWTGLGNLTVELLQQGRVLKHTHKDKQGQRDSSQ